MCGRRILFLIESSFLIDIVKPTKILCFSNQPLVATNASVQDPIAQGWCERACQPYGVAEGNPCKCSRNITAAAPTVTASGDVKSFPPKAPAVVDPNNPGLINTAAAPPVARYDTAQAQNAYYYGYAQTAAQTVPQTAPQVAAYQPQTQQGAATNPDVRALQEAAGTCGRSCAPHRVLSNNPCLCEKSAKANVPGKKIVNLRYYGEMKREMKI